MSSPASPAETRAYIVERLVGEAAEPDRILDAARALAAQILPGLAEAINQDLSFPIEVALTDAALGRFSQALAGSAPTNVVTVAASPVSADALVLDLDANAVGLLLAALLGGDPQMAGGSIDRPLSPIELEVAASTLRAVAEAVNAINVPALKLKLPVMTPFTGQDVTRHVLREGPSARLVFLLKAGSAAGSIAMTMPQRVLIGAKAEATPGNAEGWTDRFGDEVRKSAVTLDAIVPLAAMSLGDLAALRVGDLLELPAEAQSSTRLAARDRTLFLCEFGKVGQNFSVRVKQPFDEGQDFVERLLAK